MSGGCPNPRARGYAIKAEFGDGYEHGEWHEKKDNTLFVECAE